MRRFAVVWLLCVITSGAAAQAPESAPSLSKPLAQPQSDPGGNKSAEQPQRAAPPPIIVNVQPPAKTEAEAQKEEHERQEQANLDRRLVELTGDLAEYTKWLAYATAALFAVTAGLFGFAIKQARDAKNVEAAARRSADASDRSAKAAETALVGIDRPYIFIARPVIFLFARELCRYPHAEYYIHNFGRTPAIIRKRIYGLLILRSIPEVPPYDIIRCDVDWTIIAAGGEALGEAAQSDHILGDHEIEQARANALQSLFFGKIEYEDTFGSRFEMGFGYVLKPSDGRHASNNVMIACESPAYNYHRKIEA